MPAGREARGPSIRRGPARGHFIPPGRRGALRKAPPVLRSVRSCVPVMPCVPPVHRVRGSRPPYRVRGPRAARKSLIIYVLFFRTRLQKFRIPKFLPRVLSMARPGTGNTRQSRRRVGGIILQRADLSAVCTWMSGTRSDQSHESDPRSGTLSRSPPGIQP